MRGGQTSSTSSKLITDFFAMDIDHDKLKDETEEFTGILQDSQDTRTLPAELITNATMLARLREHSPLGTSYQVIL